MKLIGLLLFVVVGVIMSSTPVTPFDMLIVSTGGMLLSGIGTYLVWFGGGR